MIFTELVFVAFFASVFAAYWLVRCRKARLDVLLAASAVFYGWWDWRFLGLIAFVILVSWATALLAAGRRPGSTARRGILVAGIASNLGVLAVFKYFDFFAGSFAEILSAAGLSPSWPALQIVLPVGISFYVFQAISYVVDTARGDLEPERRLRRVALYIGFFPQLVAGPIVRAASFFPQMERAKTLSRPLLASAARAFVLGFVYKAGVADNLGALVDPVFGDALAPGDADLGAWSNSALVAATIAFGAQIYFDFAGYSLMAIGVARAFGYHIPRNFDFPYAAASIADFWRRWHISLSSWLRDYLYIPLGGGRGGLAQTCRNLMATMLLGGLWHGAAWTFVAWGALHGAALCVHRVLFASSRRRVGFVVGLAATQLFVLLAWAPFRAESFADTLEIWTAFTGLRQGGLQTLPVWAWLAPALVVLDIMAGKPAVQRLAKAPALRLPGVYWAGLGVVAGCALALYPLEAAPFVYFQF